MVSMSQNMLTTTIGKKRQQSNMNLTISKIRQLLQQHGIELVQRDELQQLIQQSKDLQFVSRIQEKGLSRLIGLLPLSQAQLRQDLFVLSSTDFLQNGYFVEFGGTDGVHWSNSYLLEQKFGWRGIISEPARGYHDALLKNRTCHIETDCVWNKTGESLRFNETKLGYFSTIDQFSEHDKHSAHRKNGARYQVPSISLLDMLEKYNAPSHIDYLSIDTEGSELEILSAFDFSRYSFSVITCEHNYTDSREKIYTLLGSHGYKRVMQDVSQFDDWYILERK